MCSVEEKLKQQNNMPSTYKRYVDDSFVVLKNRSAADDFLFTLNNSHPSVIFTMETEVDKRLPFIGMEIIRVGDHLETRVYRKSTNRGMLLITLP